MSQLEIYQYLRIFRRWWWLIFIIGFIAAAYTFITESRKPDRYQAQSTLTIGNYIESPNPDYTQIRTGMDLAYTYERLLRTFEILEGVVDALNLDFEPDALRGMISTNIISGTSLLEIRVVYTDPILASEIANELANQLILQSPTNLTAEQQAQISLLNDQIREQSQELVVLRDQLRRINNTLGGETALSEEREEELIDERTGLIDQINVASANIAQFTNTIATFQQRTNSIEIIESARIPSGPIGQNLMSTVFVSTLAALVLAFGLVIAYEYFNDTFRSADEVSSALKLPVLGVISKFGKRDATYDELMISRMPPTAQTIEEYNTLRSNLLFSVEGSPKLIAITSSSPQEGKTITSCNLAISIAKSGKRVLLIDSDMRRPKLHLAFNIENKMGLSNLLTPGNQARERVGDSGVEDEIRINYMDGDSWRQLVKPTNVDNLYIITSGYLPDNPTALLGSPLMSRWIEKIEKTKFFDVIIFDTPPVLAVADSTVLAATIDVNIILILRASRTRRGAGEKAKERFANLELPIAGVVLNSANLRDESYYGYDYSYYYRPAE